MSTIGALTSVSYPVAGYSPAAPPMAAAPVAAPAAAAPAAPVAQQTAQQLIVLAMQLLDMVA